MKKIFEKYDLLKVSGILVLVSVVLSWVLPYSYFQGSEVVADEINRVGLTNFFNYGVLSLFYFTVLVTFLFVMGGFYQVLSKRTGYQRMVDAIGKALKPFEIPIVLIVMLVFAILGSMVSEYFPLLAIIPFVIAILNRMKVDKVTSFAATFGGLLVGTIGSTFSTKVTGQFTSSTSIIQTSFAIDPAEILTTETILFIVAFIALAIFTVMRLLKTRKDKKSEVYDMYAVEENKASKDEKNKKYHVWPYAVMMILLFLTVALAYLPWETWEVTFFQDITTWFNEFKLLGVPILSYIFGELPAFGSVTKGWDIYTIQSVMLIGTLLVFIFGKMPLDEIFKSYGEGFKKIGKTVVVMLAVYFIVEIAVMYPVMPGIVSSLEGMADGFNAFFTSVGAFITSIFSGELQYMMQLTGSFYTATYVDYLPTVAIIFQSMFGLVSFFVPSSVILMMGLSYLDIKYKDWLKFIWKFLLVMLVAVAIIIAVIA